MPDQSTQSSGLLPPELRLREDESVIMALRPSPAWVVLINKVLTLGLYSLWWKRTGFVLTDQRVIYRPLCQRPVRRSPSRNQ
jgi:hypothetical protein